MMTIPAQQRTQQTSAETIGSTEEYIGRWLKGKREQIILATKFGVPMSNWLNSGGGSRENIMRAIEGSLRRLRPTTMPSGINSHTSQTRNWHTAKQGDFLCHRQIFAQPCRGPVRSISR